jgi:hypothetical protein
MSSLFRREWTDARFKLFHYLPILQFDFLNVSLGKFSQHMNSGFRELASGRELRPRLERYAKDLRRNQNEPTLSLPGLPRGLWLGRGHLDLGCFPEATVKHTDMVRCEVKDANTEVGPAMNALAAHSSI